MRSLAGRICTITTSRPFTILSTPLHRSPELAVDIDLGLAVEQDVKGITELTLGRQPLSGRRIDLIGSARNKLELALGKLREEGDPAQSIGLWIAHAVQHILLLW